MNVIHYMHDKYAYEKDSDGTARHPGTPLYVLRSRRHERVLADSLSAVKHARVKCIRDEKPD